MRIRRWARFAAAALLAFGVLSALPGASSAQQKPNPAAVETAKELLILKGGDTLFYPLITGVVETVKNVFLPTNPNLGKELNEVALQLRKEYEAKRPELLSEVATVYAERFTDQELKAMVAFYKTPLGKKMVTDEPGVLDESLRRAQLWSDALSGKVMDRFREEMKKKGHNL